MRDLETFMRIANAQLKSKIQYAPQRLAVTSKMYVRWLNRKKRNAISRTQKRQYTQELYYHLPQEKK